MSRHIENQELNNALEDCIRLMTEDQSTIDDCLKRYPHLKEELEPLLGTTHMLQTTAPVKPREEFKKSARSRLMQELEAPIQIEKQRIRPRRMMIRLLAASLALVLLFSGVAAASTNSLPDSPLYPIKRMVEQAQMLTKTNTKSHAFAHLQLAEKRLNEAEAMTKKKKIKLAKNTTEDMNQEIENALEYILQLNNKDQKTLLTKLIKLTEKQQAILKRLIGQSGENEKNELQDTDKQSKQNMEQAKEALKGTEPKTGPQKQIPRPSTQEQNNKQTNQPTDSSSKDGTGGQGGTQGSGGQQGTGSNNENSTQNNNGDSSNSQNNQSMPNSSGSTSGNGRNF